LVSVQWLVPETYWNVNPFWKTTEGEGAHGIFALSVRHGHLAWSFFPSTSPEVVVLSPPGNTDRRDRKSNSLVTFARRTLFGSDLYTNRTPTILAQIWSAHDPFCYASRFALRAVKAAPRVKRIFKDSNCGFEKRESIT
jgi:hypothetical protein